MYQAFNTRPEGKPRVYQAFNARPEGATSSQPRASERSERHPGLGRRVSDTPPEGAKAATGGIFRHNFPPPSPHPRRHRRISSSVIAFAPSGGVSLSPLPNPGCRVASLAYPGLGARCPFGARVERMTHAWTSFGARVERMTHAWTSFGARVQRMTHAQTPFGAPPPRNPPSGNPTPPSGNPTPPFGKPPPPSGKPRPVLPPPRPAARKETSKLIHPYTTKKTLFA